MNKKTIITILLAIVMAPLGLEAKKKAKTVEVPQLINYPSAELSEYRLHGGNVAIRGIREIIINRLMKKLKLIDLDK